MRGKKLVRRLLVLDSEATEDKKKKKMNGDQALSKHAGVG